MNKSEMDILNTIYKNKHCNQRMLAELSGHSLGIVNRSVRELAEEGYIDDELNITARAVKEFEEKAPRNAIILAAGFGMRMVPINTEIPKGLLEINGEPLIERTIKQLKEAGITKIYVVVGFLKERYEYLMDEYGVELIVNPEYAVKNNLYSLKKAMKYLGNTYIIPCDIWCDRNPYHQNELYSWYMVSELIDNDSSVRVNRKMELVATAKTEAGNAMVGISYLLESDARIVSERILELCKQESSDSMFWEEALFDKGKMIVAAKVVPSSEVVEINTYEQLREIDNGSGHLKTDAIDVICTALHTEPEGITNIAVLKKGMTNRSFLFSCDKQKYIMRIPGEGTDQLINRTQEAEVYKVINGRNICDEIVYMNPDNGYKITRFLENARVCDPNSDSDIQKCMEKLRKLHKLQLKVNHEFQIFSQIDFYESLWNGQPSVYRDYLNTKKNVKSLQTYIERYAEKKVLTHIDAVPDNFLFITNDDGKEEIRLIDWEYAGMQDPHVDIAMFCIYSLYDREQVDRLIDLYFIGGCRKEIRIKIYCYIAACGLLWSNWCEYKRNLGIDFGEYSLRQYRYAKDYYQIVQKELMQEKENQYA